VTCGDAIRRSIFSQIACELAVNAVLHSHSGRPGGRFTIHVQVRDGEWVRVQVGDEGGPAPVRMRAAGEGDGGDGTGQGLRIVDVLADEWGVAGDAAGRVVWFRAAWGTA
jgi:anti-sigma regulatory factor (Ser/Thr protein kinase)